MVARLPRCIENGRQEEGKSEQSWCPGLKMGLRKAKYLEHLVFCLGHQIKNAADKRKNIRGGQVW